MMNGYIKELEREVKEQRAYAEAVKEEFAKMNKEDPEWGSEAIREKIRTELMPAAFAQLKTLMETADSESVRANLIKYILDTELNKPVKGVDPNDADEGLKRLLEKVVIDGVNK